jgi:hypothetical protein
VINYALGPDTERVTAGAGETRTVVVLDGHGFRLPADLKPLEPVLTELSELVGHCPIDIDFAISSRHDVIVFQVRPLVLSSQRHLAHRAGFPGVVHQVRQCFANVVRHNNRNGLDGAIFGVMPDWNPAELIRFKPRRSWPPTF